MPHGLRQPAAAVQTKDRLHPVGFEQLFGLGNATLQVVGS